MYSTDLWLATIFHPTSGVIPFLHKLYPLKDFVNPVSQCLELLNTLTNNFPSDVKKYILEIRGVCRRIIASSAPASVKEKASSLLYVVLEKASDDVDALYDLYEFLQNCANVRLDKSDKGDITITIIDEFL